MTHHITQKTTQGLINP